MRENWEFRPNHTKFYSKSPDFPLPEKETTPNTMENSILSIFFKQPLTPSTVTLSVEGKNLVVHALYV